jgi:hypothetical protein
MEKLFNERALPYPTREEVIKYFTENYKEPNLDLEKEGRLFFNYYNGQDWYTGGPGKGRKITNWINKADSWIQDKAEKAKNAVDKASVKARTNYEHDQNGFDERGEILKKLVNPKNRS